MAIRFSHPNRPVKKAPLVQAPQPAGLGQSPQPPSKEDAVRVLKEAVEGSRGPKKKSTKISIRVDDGVLEWFRSQGTGWQTMMNTAAREYMEREGGLPVAPTPK